MTNNFLKFTVIFLAILIFICFVFLLYGLYSNISNNEVFSSQQIANYSLDLGNSEKIKDIKIINENNLLIVVSNNNEIYLVIYNLNEKELYQK